MIKITLNIDEKEKTFAVPFIKARMLKRTLAISKEFDKDFSEESLDKIVDYEVELYGNQFTSDELYDGYPSDKLFNKVLEDIDSVMGNMNSKLNNIAAKN